MGHWSTNGAAREGRCDSRAARSFTPIELLMVVTLLGIVLATLVPRILTANEETRQNTLLQRLHSVRRQIEKFRQTHDGRLPAEGRNSADELLRELRNLENAANDSGSSEAVVMRVENILPPLNPYTKNLDILVIPESLQRHHYSGSGRHGWAYSSTTGEFRANLAPQVRDRSGRLINQL